MSTTELDTFVQKFHQLWNAGLNAHLDLDCHAGVAWVGLRLQLGHPPGPKHHQVFPSSGHRKVFSPSYQRRRERRSAARASNDKPADAEEASNQTNHEETMDMNGGAEEASTESDIVTANMNKTNENDDEGEHVEVEVGEVQENHDFQQNVNNDKRFT